MNTIIFYFIIALLLIIIFVEGIMIIDQEMRLSRLAAEAYELKNKTEQVLESANDLIDIVREVYEPATATSTPLEE